MPKVTEQEFVDEWGEHTPEADEEMAKALQDMDDEDGAGYYDCEEVDDDLH